MQAAETTAVRVQDQRSRSRRASFTPSTAAWCKLAVAYLLAGVVLGVAMGASEDFTLRSVHSHLSLLGWTTLALAGLIYHQFPEARGSRLAVIHFWTYNLALPPMMASLAALLLGHPGALPILVVSQTLASVGVLAFVANVFLHVRAVD